MYNRYPIQKVLHRLSNLNQVRTSFLIHEGTLIYSVFTCVYNTLSIHSSEQGMPHHVLTTTTLRFPTSFLLVLLINQHTINHRTLAPLHHHTQATFRHHTLATLHRHTQATFRHHTQATFCHHTLATHHHQTLATLHHQTLDTLHHHTLATLHHHTLHHQTLATLSQDINTLLSMFATIETHHPPSSHLLMVHIIAASHHASTLELKYKNQVAKVTFVALHLCFHAKFWGKHRNALFTGWWWSLSIENEYARLCFPAYESVSHPMFLFL